MGWDDINREKWKEGSSKGGQVIRARFQEVRREYEEYPKLCGHCKTPIPYDRRKNKYCSRKCSASLTNVGKVKTDLTKSKLRNAAYEQIKNGDRHTFKRSVKLIEITCKTCKTSFETFPCYSNRKYCSRSCTDADVGRLKGKCGGYREGSGRSKRGQFRGHYCASTYELAWIVYHLDHDISFERNVEGFPYQYKGNDHLYYPDFIVDGKYIEVKGYKTEQDDFKWANFPHELNVLYRKELSHVIEYVCSTYGVKELELHTLYD